MEDQEYRDTTAGIVAASKELLGGLDTGNQFRIDVAKKLLREELAKLDEIMRRWKEEMRDGRQPGSY